MAKKKEEVVVQISTDGDVLVDAEGFQGKDCVKATEAFVEALGEVKERKLKPEYRKAKRTGQAASTRMRQG